MYFGLQERENGTKKKLIVVIYLVILECNTHNHETESMVVHLLRGCMNNFHHRRTPYALPEKSMKKKIVMSPNDAPTKLTRENF